MIHCYRDCIDRPMFSLRKGAVMKGLKHPRYVWAFSIYLFATNLKDVSSMKLHRELGIGQKAAWVAHYRLRKTKAWVTKQTRARVVESNDKPTLQGFVIKYTTPDATVFVDKAPTYEGQAGKHSVKEFVRGREHKNGVESFWSMLKRGYVCVYRKVSPKHLNRHVTEFRGRHSDCGRGTIDRTGEIVEGMGGKRIRYRDLTRPSGLPAGAKG